MLKFDALRKLHKINLLSVVNAKDTTLRRILLFKLKNHIALNEAKWDEIREENSGKITKFQQRNSGQKTDLFCLTLG